MQQHATLIIVSHSSSLPSGTLCPSPHFASFSADSFLFQNCFEKDHSLVNVGPRLFCGLHGPRSVNMFNNCSKIVLCCCCCSCCFCYCCHSYFLFFVMLCRNKNADHMKSSAQVCFRPICSQNFITLGIDKNVLFSLINLR